MDVLFLWFIKTQRLVYYKIGIIINNREKEYGTTTGHSNNKIFVVLSSTYINIKCSFETNLCIVK